MPGPIKLYGSSLVIESKSLNKNQTMRKIMIMSLLLTLSLTAMAQGKKISGTIVDKESNEAMMQVTVQLLKPDSTFVVGAVSNMEGVFTLTAPKNGKYLLKLTSVGYVAHVQSVEMQKSKDLDLGTIAMAPDAVMLEEAKITANAMKMVIKGDTTEFNADAYRTPEGSVVEELVKRLPGAQVSEDGKVTINGKSVSKIKVNGKEFMLNDTETAMKNLPTAVVEKVKAYEEKSDLARVTGIDDGNEEMVLDFGLRRGMNQGIFANANGGIGTHGRYTGRGMGAFMQDNVRLMLFANGNNVGDRGFGAGRGGGNGLQQSKMLGTNINYETTKLKFNANVRWNHRNTDVNTQSSVENFVSTVGAFSNSLSQSYSRANSWNGNIRLEWMPDSMTNLLFRPNISFNKNDSRSWNQSASFNADPYKYVTDPLSAITRLADEDAVLNSRNGNSIGYNETERVGGMLQFNRKLNNSGRNVTLRADASYSKGASNNLSTNNVHLYQVLDQSGKDSTYQTNRYRTTPTRNYNYTLQTTYSEPLWKATYLQFSYKFSYGYSKSDQSTYDFSNLGEGFFSGLTPYYRDWNSWLSRLSNPAFGADYLDTNLSKYSEYHTYTHDIELMFRMIRESYQLNAGVLFQPQHTNFVQEYMGVSADTTRNVFNVTPTLDFRYNFNRQKQMRFTYRGRTSQPSMADLLDIVDDSDPLNITRGNRGLKPMFTNTFHGEYRNAVQWHQQNMFFSTDFNTIRNNISQMVTYDEANGGRTSRPENISGDWNASLFGMYSASVDTMGVWMMSGMGGGSYNNRVSYVTLNNQAGPQKNYTRTTVLWARLAPSYRGSWLEVELNGMLNYQHSDNKLVKMTDPDTWSFNYGTTIDITLPWNMHLNSSITMNSRRGYSDQSLNTNELIWNAQISQSFLRKKNLLVMLQFFDILQEQSNFTRSINAMMRNDTQNNAINSYAMLNVTYRFDFFKGMKGFGGPGQGGPGGRGPEGGRGGFGGGRPPMGGGFGGGRPM